MPGRRGHQGRRLRSDPAQPVGNSDTTVRIEDLSTASAALLVKPLVGRVGLEPTTGGL
jgi:hypothetical protein